MAGRLNSFVVNMKGMVLQRIIVAGILCGGMIVQLTATAQSPWIRLGQRPSTLGLDQGTLDLQTQAFRLKLVKASQTVAALSPVTLPGFDFTPGDSIKVRSSNGMYQLGDITLRLRAAGDTGWKSYSTAAGRKPVTALTAGAGVLAAADLAASLPAGIPLQVKRYWEVVNNRLTLRFELSNTTGQPVEIGALGIPMIFNNLLAGKTLEQTHADNVFFDPYTGADAGYLQVARLSGEKPVMLVVPLGKTPFEAYNPLLDDPTPRGIGFEGFHEWMVHSKAYAEKEWKQAQPWNEPTSAVLKPGEKRNYGVQFIVTDDLRKIEKTLAENGRPVAVGIPGYVVPQDVDASLFLQYGKKVKEVAVNPAGALKITARPALSNGWQAYSVQGKTNGRVRLTITYTDGTVQTIQYKVSKPEKAVIADYGRFLTQDQWYVNNNDLFHRSPSVISYDYEKKQQVTQDSRAWIAGLSDEGGAGGWLGAAMKQLVLPDQKQVQQLEQFVDQTLWGRLQVSEGPEKYGVRKSLYYYEPDSMPAGTYSKEINYKTWSAWPKKEAMSLGRSYNYPHVTAAYWVLYRLARYNKGLVTNHDWQWYLQQAHRTAMAMVQHAPYYAEFGQMEGSVFCLVLKDLKAEGLQTDANELEGVMKKRALHWKSLKYPFGSEMPWDSTGQEEVYIWSLFFGFEEKADVTLKAILAYMPAIPSWAYNGNARRYWDFLYGGKLSRIERMIHHYGSELNAIPVLTEYRRKPDDFYLLRVGYGGLQGGISTITEDGFAPCAFHSFPATLENDGLSGDYGSGFYGYAVNTGSYLVKHSTFGWLGFGGNVQVKGSTVTLRPTTAAANAVYVAPVGVWVTLAAGRLQSVQYNTVTKAITVTLPAADAHVANAYVKAEQEAVAYKGKEYVPSATLAKQGGYYVVPLGTQSKNITLQLSSR